MALKVAPKPTKKPITVDDGDDNAQLRKKPATDVTEPAEGTDETDEATETPEAPQTKTTTAEVKTVSLAPVSTDQVTMTMLADIEPPPVIGSYDCARVHNVRKLAKGASYVVPREVAAQVADAGKCVVTP